METSSKKIPFTKMQGAGNDFVVLDNRQNLFSKDEIVEWAPRITHRRYGVGSDGVLALLPPEREGMDYTMFYRNPDGSDAGMCGNGARCLALFAHALGYPSNHRFNVHHREFEAEIEPPETVRISFPMETLVKEIEIDQQKIFEIHTGTEHIVIELDEPALQEEAFLQTEGSRLRHHPRFQPKGTNVNFIHGINDSTVKLQTFERGVEDLTLACGTGAIASALIWHHIQETKTDLNKYKVEAQGGTLSVYFSFKDKSETYLNIKLEGPAHFVFKGEILL